MQRLTGVDDSFVTAHGGQGAADPVGAWGISPEERRQRIEAAAYRRFEQRCGTPGDPVNDWLEAEKEIDATLAAGEAHETAKSAVLSMLSSALAECQMHVDDIRERAKIASVSLKREYDEQLAAVTPKYEAARQKLTELREQTDDAWEHLRAGAEKAFTELRAAVRQAASEFK